MGPVDQDHGVEAAIQPNFGKRANSKTGVAPEVCQTDDLGSFQDGRIIVETEAIIKVEVEQDVRAARGSRLGLACAAHAEEVLEVAEHIVEVAALEEA